MKLKQPLNIILLGDPGSGKGTQAKTLLKKYQMTDIDVGKELRKLWVKDKKFSKKYQASYDKGFIMTSKVVAEMFRKMVFGAPKNKGLLFNGGPKKIAEAKLITNWLKKLQREDPLVFYISIPIAERRKRLMARKEYLLGKLSRRAEDSPQSQDRRFKEHQKNLSKVVAYLKPRYKFAGINGVGTPQQVYKRIQKVIDSHLKHREKVH